MGRFQRLQQRDECVAGNPQAHGRLVSSDEKYLAILLGNLSDFDPVVQSLPLGELVAVDRWAVERTRALQVEILAAYDSYEFHRVYQLLHNFCVVDLGSFTWM